MIHFRIHVNQYFFRLLFLKTSWISCEIAWLCSIEILQMLSFYWLSLLRMCSLIFQIVSINTPTIILDNFILLRGFKIRVNGLIRLIKPRFYFNRSSGRSQSFAEISHGFTHLFLYSDVCQVQLVRCNSFDTQIIECSSIGALTILICETVILYLWFRRWNWMLVVRVFWIVFLDSS